ncbi:MULTISPECIES: hypothetical protein [unclassified Bradyrhizobium]|uniref:hypothetical protein n=1 Tax=unclassified Bradyrhizobium TaxID=2631580 RepID=UPI001FF3E6D8|nr:MULTISPECIES: hypothetical protein [unclassified Bradyrhizobium]MCJ9699904.1 hypothetical protein [Bradyrhizobium sp. SHOUNA76]MCJ9728860.1 hypothetical protein [Bradyrhizobium sp. PRIMUS42]
MKHVENRPFADPQVAARKLIELAASVEPVNGRIHIEKNNAPFLSKNGCKATGAEFGAGIPPARKRPEAGAVSPPRSGLEFAYGSSPSIAPADQDERPIYICQTVASS